MIRHDLQKIKYYLGKTGIHLEKMQYQANLTTALIRTADLRKSEPNNNSPHT